MRADTRFCLITPTWSGDIDHFRLLRASLDRSPLVDVPHHVVVQTEDRALFDEFKSPAMRLCTTADVLPPDVEAARQWARLASNRLGRHLTRLSGSVNQATGWPHWPALTGWHTQQICKYAVARASGVDVAVVLDSDVIVTPWATLSDFQTEEHIRCFATWDKRSDIKGKVRNWVNQAEQLTEFVPVVGSQVNTYFDTPFILNCSVMNEMLDWLETRHQAPWWQVMLSQPPRRWSEFGTYKAYLAKVAADRVDWCEPSMGRYLYDTSDEDRLAEQVKCFLKDPAIHFFSIHSQNSGRAQGNAFNPSFLHSLITGN